jgi:hypothetical protein
VSAWEEDLLGLLTFAIGVGIAEYSYWIGFRAGVRSQRVSDMGWPSAWRPTPPVKKPARCDEAGSAAGHAPAAAFPALGRNGKT